MQLGLQHRMARHHKRGTAWFIQFTLLPCGNTSGKSSFILFPWASLHPSNSTHPISHRLIRAAPTATFAVEPHFSRPRKVHPELLCLLDSSSHLIVRLRFPLAVMMAQYTIYLVPIQRRCSHGHDFTQRKSGAPLHLAIRRASGLGLKATLNQLHNSAAILRSNTGASS
ncbi:hypothetical protein B0T22DRAFT_461483 [Podospora appendiculata]|uniref:Uncharacterized protein n=1 Tax=Podospora appendiculata TaxID=314037 RepID=A0AAE0XB23_9PEZI|nr:hypothetical protein B0T22DRAFT_461483 [Podospora appendiculata]